MWWTTALTTLTWRKGSTHITGNIGGTKESRVFCLFCNSCMPDCLVDESVSSSNHSGAPTLPHAWDWTAGSSCVISVLKYIHIHKGSQRVVERCQASWIRELGRTPKQGRVWCPAPSSSCREASFPSFALTLAHGTFPHNLGCPG